MPARACALCVALVFVPGAARAQRSSEPVVHEFVPDTDERIAGHAVPGSPAAAAGADPSAASVMPGASGTFDMGASSDPSDAAGPPPPPDRAPLLAPPAPFDDEPAFSPDRNTRLDGELTYEEVFTPSIAPFKRGVVLDRVRPDFTLGIGDSRLR